MKQELGPLQTKWVELLESGDYEQGVGRLRIKDKYCCLGLAQVIVCKVPTDSAGQGSLSEEVVDKMKFRDINGGPRSIDSRDYLTTMNDQLRKTFKEIASVVREDPSDYFTEPA